MKITNDTLLAELQRLGDSSTGQAAESNFKDILAMAMGRGQTQEAGETSATGSANNTSQTSLPQVWYQMSSVLESLEAYGQALGDTSMSMKDLEPLAQGLEQQAQELAAHLEEDAGGTLGELGNQLLSQARMAAFQYRRGDYV